MVWKFHLEMILWHQLQFATWGHPELLDRSLSWYLKAEKNARKIAERQGFKGVRWMKMTDLMPARLHRVRAVS